MASHRVEIASYNLRLVEHHILAGVAWNLGLVAANAVLPIIGIGTASVLERTLLVEPGPRTGIGHDVVNVVIVSVVVVVVRGMEDAVG